MPEMDYAYSYHWSAKGRLISRVDDHWALPSLIESLLHVYVYYVSLFDSFKKRS